MAATVGRRLGSGGSRRGGSGAGLGSDDAGALLGVSESGGGDVDGGGVDATALGRRAAVDDTSESHSPQKASSARTGAPHAGQTVSMGTHRVSGVTDVKGIGDRA